jgi:hypothetical protein
MVAGALALLAAGMLTASVVSFARSAPAERTAVPLASIPQGVSAHVVDGFAAVAVRTGESVTMLVGGTARGEVLAYCAPSPRFPDGVLIEPRGGSAFDLAGKKLGGPAPRGLDRFPAQIDGDRVLVDASHPVLAPPIAVGATPTAAFTPRFSPTVWTNALLGGNPACAFFR